MGLAKLNVWIHDVVDPCKISDQTWLVNVTDCNNRVVEWCGRKYAAIPAQCGHIEIDLPPGCYTVWGALSVAIIPPFLYANYITHFCIVTVGCDEKACVQLYAPSYRWCWRSFFFATEILAQQQGIPRDKADRLLEALNAVIEHVPKTASDAELEELLKELPKIIRQKPEKRKDSAE